MHATVVGAVQHIIALIRPINVQSEGRPKVTAEADGREATVAGLVAMLAVAVTVAGDVGCALWDAPDFVASGTFNLHGLRCH